MTKKTIDLVIFDLGRVLIDFDFRRVIGELKRHTTKTDQQIHDFFETTPMWDAFERGKLTPEQFFTGLTRDLELHDLDFTQFSFLWSDIFTENKGTVALLHRLKEKYRTAILSNVNEMHWKHVREKHAFIDGVDYPVASYAVGMRKPDAEIYQHVLQLAGVPASRAVFIDDLKIHIDAARALGIRAHHFTTAPQLQKDLEDLL